MAGVTELRYLNMSNNKLSSIPSEFLLGLNKLEELDISHNQLLTVHPVLKVGNFKYTCVVFEINRFRDAVSRRVSKFFINHSSFLFSLGFSIYFSKIRRAIEKCNFF